MRVMLPFLLAMCACMAQANEIYKCVQNGRVVYADLPCAIDGSKNQQLQLSAMQRSGQETPRQADAMPSTPKIPRTAAKHGNTSSKGLSLQAQVRADKNKQHCLALEQKIADLEAEARQGAKADKQDRLTQRKRKVRQQQQALHC